MPAPAPEWALSHPKPVAELAETYRHQVLDKLPPASILPPHDYPLGSDVSLVPETCGLLSQRQVRSQPPFPGRYHPVPGATGIAAPLSSTIY